MKDDLKILKVEYLRNHLLDYTQILNLSLDGQTIFCKSLKLRGPQNMKSGMLKYYTLAKRTSMKKWKCLDQNPILKWNLVL